MDDQKAQEAYDAYTAYYERARQNPVPTVGADWPKILEGLHNAADYLAMLPIDSITSEHERLAAKIEAILQRDHHA